METFRIKLQKISLFDNNYDAINDIFFLGISVINSHQEISKLNVTNIIENSEKRKIIPITTRFKIYDGNYDLQLRFCLNNSNNEDEISQGILTISKSCKRKIILDLSRDGKSIGNIELTLYIDDYHVKYFNSHHRIKIFHQFLDLISSYGWIIILFISLRSWLQPLRIIDEEFNHEFMNTTSQAIFLRPGMTLMQDDYISCCKSKSSSFSLLTSCDPVFLHLNRNGTFGLYAGLMPNDSMENFNVIWEKKLSDDNKNHFKKFADHIQNNILKSKNYVFMIRINRNNELILSRNNKIIWILSLNNQIPELSGLTLM